MFTQAGLLFALKLLELGSWLSFDCISWHFVHLCTLCGACVHFGFRATVQVAAMCPSRCTTGSLRRLWRFSWISTPSELISVHRPALLLNRTTQCDCNFKREGPNTKCLKQTCCTVNMLHWLKPDWTCKQRELCMYRCVLYASHHANHIKRVEWRVTTVLTKHCVWVLHSIRFKLFSLAFRAPKVPERVSAYIFERLLNSKAYQTDRGD